MAAILRHVCESVSKARIPGLGAYHRVVHVHLRHSLLHALVLLTVSVSVVIVVWAVLSLWIPGSVVRFLDFVISEV